VLANVLLFDTSNVLLWWLSSLAILIHFLKFFLVPLE
jgi:hypothetical protein